jgi:hypothetical protein
MPRHRITAASLLDEIERRRATEASARWQELTREFMREDAAADRPDTSATRRPH